jgi:hypothetical protein
MEKETPKGGIWLLYLNDKHNGCKKILRQDAEAQKTRFVISTEGRNPS